MDARPHVLLDAIGNAPVATEMQGEQALCSSEGIGQVDYHMLSQTR